MIFVAFIIAVPLLLLSGAALWNSSRTDAVLLLAGGALAFGHLLLWQTGDVSRLPALLLPASLLTAPYVLYAIGLVYVVRALMVPLDRWVRRLYLFAGLGALAPLIVFFVFFPILHLL
jgi:hypothetical protein